MLADIGLQREGFTLRAIFIFLLLLCFISPVVALAQDTSVFRCRGTNMPEIPCPSEETACGPIAIDWEGFIFAACNCYDQRKFEVGDSIGVRMPVILPPSAWAVWLEPATAPGSLPALLKTCPEGQMAERLADARINSPDFEPETPG